MRVTDSKVEEAHIALVADACSNSSSDFDEEEVVPFDLDLVRQAYLEVVSNDKLIEMYKSLKRNFKD